MIEAPHPIPVQEMAAHLEKVWADQAPIRIHVEYRSTEKVVVAAYTTKGKKIDARMVNLKGPEPE